MTVSTVSVGEMMWSTSRILKLINEHNGNNLVLKLLFLIKTAPLLKCAWPCSSFSLYRHWPGFSACSLKADDLRALSRETGIPVTLVKPFTFPRGLQSFPQTDKAKPGCHISLSCFYLWGFDLTPATLQDGCKAQVFTDMQFSAGFRFICKSSADGRL